MIKKISITCLLLMAMTMSIFGVEARISVGEQRFFLRVVTLGVLLM